MTQLRSVLSLALLCAAGCTQGSAYDRSCAGEAVTDCLPFEYTVMQSATVTPSALRPAEPGVQARLQLEFKRCARFTRTHRVTMAARVGGQDVGLDGSTGGGQMFLVTVADDGTGGDATAGDGRIDVLVPNPFTGTVPERSNLVLRFTPEVSTCAGEPLEITYRTGERWTPPR